MQTRFNSTLNNPSKLTLTSKHKVMMDFKRIQYDMQRIKQEKVRPADDPDMPDFLQKFQEMTMLTHSDIRSASLPEGAGTAVVGGDFSQH